MSQISAILVSPEGSATAYDLLLRRLAELEAVFQVSSSAFHDLLNHCLFFGHQVIEGRPVQYALFFALSTTFEYISRYTMSHPIQNLSGSESLCKNFDKVSFGDCWQDPSLYEQPTR